MPISQAAEKNDFSARLIETESLLRNAIKQRNVRKIYLYLYFFPRLQTPAL